jgi:NAD(P)H-flavin reductase
MPEIQAHEKAMPAKQSIFCKVRKSVLINSEIFSLDFAWPGPVPKAGQFFMIKPKRASVFLARPVSVALWQPPDTLSFLIALRGMGTEELSWMQIDEEAELTGPLGNCWEDFLPPAHKRATGFKTKKEASKAAGGAKFVKIALISGGIGAAPLEALASALPRDSFDFLAGFRTGFKNDEERNALLGPAALPSPQLIIATEDGSEWRKGRIPDFLDAAKYAAVYACGPEPMLKATAARCKEAKVPCFVSMERRMACGAGACLGCTVETINGNRRCCTDGPIFPAQEILFDE